MFSEYYFYLVGFIRDIDREQEFHNPDDLFPTIYRVDRIIEFHETGERFVCEYRMVQPPNPPMEKLVDELCQKGYDLYLMSNTSHRFRIFSRYIKSIAYMKGIWISCEHGLLKPEPEAYLDFFRTFSLKPETCFFIDDTPANIEAAGNLGMDGCVYYGDVDELRRCLDEKLL